MKLPDVPGTHKRLSIINVYVIYQSGNVAGLADPPEVVIDLPAVDGLKAPAL
ncbi:hypothetical protein [Gynuella sunshinyii]|uniref:Uncharacterized protein n=1 Tax=Gynuella sunshinyii YC6258 TaxID=1445510 RepID=A0A0C5VJJ6_9GAMM|nr:hypothetical protein [Gynuella sunshinyii]AJQ94812.1 hypothetical Protein YC6258_02774 [Gynuella sunshinyii YC6258]